MRVMKLLLGIVVGVMTLTTMGNLSISQEEGRRGPPGGERGGPGGGDRRGGPPGGGFMRMGGIPSLIRFEEVQKELT